MTRTPQIRVEPKKQEKFVAFFKKKKILLKAKRKDD
jgi:hypothetical protein